MFRSAPAPSIGAASKGRKPWKDAIAEYKAREEARLARETEAKKATATKPPTTREIREAAVTEQIKLEREKFRIEREIQAAKEEQALSARYASHETARLKARKKAAAEKKSIEQMASFASINGLATYSSRRSDRSALPSIVNKPKGIQALGEATADCSKGLRRP